MSFITRGPTSVGTGRRWAGGSAEEPNGNAEQVRVLERYAPVDAARMAELDEVIRQSTCRFCGRHLSDKVLDRTPGLCSQPACRRAARREARRVACRSD